MASVLDDPEFWLPTQFLSDNDSVTDYKSLGVESSESNSGFTSPINSTASMTSTETESEEDEFLTELTRRLASFTHFSQDFCKPKPKPNNGLTHDRTNTSWKMATSPESTLNNAVGWDSPEKPCTISVSSNTKYYEYQSIQPIQYHYHYVQCNQQPRTKLQKAFVENIQQCQQNGVMTSSKRSGSSPLGLSSSAWPSLHQSHKQLAAASWTTPVFSVSNRGCSGTGVFLPRPVGTVSTKTTCQKPAFRKQRSGMAVLAQAQQRQDRAWSPVAAISDEVRLPQEWTY